VLQDAGKVGMADNLFYDYVAPFGIGIDYAIHDHPDEEYLIVK